MTAIKFIVHFSTVIVQIEFTLQPEDTRGAFGEQVGLYCEFTGVTSLPSWSINGTIYSPLELPSLYTVNSTGLFVNAIPEMNGTYYQCMVGQKLISTVGQLFVYDSGEGKYQFTPTALL